MVDPNKQTSQTPPQDWLKVEANGDLFLQHLLTEREEIGNHKDEYNLAKYQKLMKDTSEAITHRLAELGMTGWEWQDQQHRDAQ